MDPGKRLAMLGCINPLANLSLLRLVAKFNQTHTIGDIRRYIDA